MEKLHIETDNIKSFRLIGISLPNKTSNLNGQSQQECGDLWRKFFQENYKEYIPEKQSDEIVAAYFGYEGDHTGLYSYFIGMKVNTNTSPPPGLQYLNITAGKYLKITAKGKMPECISDTWQDVWKSDLNRSYRFDFEIYDERSTNWDDAEVDIFIGIN